MKVIVEKAYDNSTESMHKQIKEMAKITELIIILGNKKNPSINRMYQIGLKESGNVMLVKNMNDLYLNYIRRFKTVGLIHDDFLPQEKIEEIINILEDTQVEGYIYGHFK